MKHKELLLKNLCARLPYGLVIDYNGIRTTLHDIKVFRLYDGDTIKDYTCLIDVFEDNDYVDVENIKPYLFPLSSMTDEQKEEYCSLQQKIIYNSKGLINSDVMEYVNWCYKNHIDINNLIPMGLANDATGLNIY